MYPCKTLFADYCILRELKVMQLLCSISSPQSQMQALIAAQRSVPTNTPNSKNLPPKSLVARLRKLLTSAYLSTLSALLSKTSSSCFSRSCVLGVSWWFMITWNSDSAAANPSFADFCLEKPRRSSLLSLVATGAFTTGFMPLAFGVQPCRILGVVVLRMPRAGQAWRRNGFYQF